MPPLPSTLTPLAATAAQKQIPISNDGLDAVDYGNVRFFNFSDEEIGILLGEARARIRMGESAVFPLPDGEAIRLRLRIIRQINGSWIDHLSTSFKPRRSDIRLNMITHMRPNETPAAPASFSTFNLRGNPLEILEAPIMAR